MADLWGANLYETLEKIREYLGNPADYKQRILSSEWAVVFYEGLINQQELSPDVPDSSGRWKESEDMTRALAELPLGHAIYLKWDRKKPQIYTIDVPGWQLRAITEPSSEQLIRGPREGFTETLSANTAMLRRWITDPKLRIDGLEVGKRTKTAVRMLYIDDIAAPDLVKEVRKRISDIEIDGIIESGYIEQLITDNRLTIFPLIQSTERTDTVAAAILEGRVAILVDKSPFALIVPTTVNELYQSPEDYYFNYYLGSFLRGIRLLGNNVAVAISGLYVALTSSNPELLPTNFAFSIAESRRGIPYPIFIEVLLLEIMVEVFREAGLRLPKNVNQTLGVVSGIALALAAVQTHLVSGATLVVVAVSAIASFSTPNFSVGISWRIFKFLFIFGAAFMGIVGLTLTGLLILAHAATLTSFGTSYLAPWAPVNSYELQDSIIRMPLWRRIFRPKSYRPQNKTRMSQHESNKNPNEGD